MTVQETLSQPWWRSGYVWLIIGLTAAAVAASAVTLYLALQVPLEPVADGPGHAAVEAAGGDALEPALQARNRTSSRNARAMAGERGRPGAPSGRVPGRVSGQ